MQNNIWGNTRRLSAACYWIEFSFFLLFFPNNTQKKLLDSDWLRAVQFKCNTCAKSVTPVHIVILDYDWRKDNEKFCRLMICNAMTNISYGNSEKSFLECENNRFKKYLPALTQREFFHNCIINK